MSTQIFISWSGELSHKVAKLLHEWIPTVLQSAEPFLSSTDIEKGSRWSDHVAQKLEECGFGVIVLTKTNLAAPWILFEAGALSKMVGRAQVSSLLIGVDVVDVKLPLSQFQNTVFDQGDVAKLIHSVNRAGPNPLRDDVLERTFNALWPDFERSALQAVDDSSKTEVVPPTTNSDPEIASIRSSVGELIQIVQSMREDVKRSGGSGMDSQTLIREVRYAARRSASLPYGVLKDVTAVLTELESRRDVLEETVTIEDSAIEGMILRLSRAANYMERESRGRVPSRGLEQINAGRMVEEQAVEKQGD